MIKQEDGWVIDLKDAEQVDLSRAFMNTFSIKAKFTIDPLFDVEESLGGGVLMMEPSRAWWQNIIPISHVYLLRNIECEPCDGSIILEADIDGDGRDLKMYWRWRIPRWIKKLGKVLR